MVLSVRSALILSAALVLAGKLSGFLRDLTIAIVYGADKTTDAFFIANTIPSLSLTAFYSTIPLAFMPFYIRHLRERGPEQANTYANAMLLVYMTVTLLITFVSIALAPFFVHTLAPEIDPASKALATELVRILSASFVFSVACAYFSAIQYAHDIRLGQQLSPIVNNTIFIIAVFLLGSFYGIRLAAMAAVAGWVVQLPLQYYFTSGHFRFERPSLPGRAEMRELIVFSAPVFLALFLEQAINATAVWLASSLKEGAVSIVTYANKLANLPLTLAAMFVTIYVYPAIIRAAAASDADLFAARARQTMKLVALMALPVTILCWYERELIARVAFGASRLAAADIKTVGEVFALYMVGIFFLILRDILNRCAYARERGYGVLWVTAIFVVVNIGLGWLLRRELGLQGIALGTSLSALLAFAIQLAAFRRSSGRNIVEFRFVIILAASGLGMAAVLHAGGMFPLVAGPAGHVLSAGLSVLAYVFLVWVLNGLQFLRNWV